MCDCWTEETPDAASFQFVDEPGMLAQALEQEHYEVFDLIQPPDPGDLRKFTAAERKKAAEEVKKDPEKTNPVPGQRKYLTTTIHRCPTCTRSCYLNVSEVTLGPDDQGNDSESKANLVENLHVPQEVVDKLLALKDRPATSEVEAGTDGSGELDDSSPSN
jgi:hypothetical protein